MVFNLLAVRLKPRSCCRIHSEPMWGWCYCMTDKYLIVFLGFEDTINPDLDPNFICRHESPELARNLALVLLSPAPQQTNCLLLQPHASSVDPSVRSPCFCVSWPHFLCFCASSRCLAFYFLVWLFICGSSIKDRFLSSQQACTV